MEKGSSLLLGVLAMGFAKALAALLTVATVVTSRPAAAVVSYAQTVWRCCKVVGQLIPSQCCQDLWALGLCLRQATGLSA